MYKIEEVFLKVFLGRLLRVIPFTEGILTNTLPTEKF